MSNPFTRLRERFRDAFGRPAPGWETPEGQAELRAIVRDMTGEIPRIRDLDPDDGTTEVYPAVTAYRPRHAKGAHRDRD